MLKKFGVSVLSVAILLFSLSFQSNAAACLDVRDYGYHKYDHRINESGEWNDPVKQSYKYYKTISYTDELNYKEELFEVTYWKIFKTVTHICICGASYNEIVHVRNGDDEKGLGKYRVTEDGLTHYE